MRFPPSAALALTLALAACAQAPEELGDKDGDLTGAPQVSAKKFFASQRAVPNKYIVVLAQPEGTAAQAVGAAAQALAARHGARVERVYTAALRGFAADMTPARAQAMANDPEVAYVEEDAEVHAIATQTGATWGLDRIDQRDLPLDGSYTYAVNGSNVNAYIVDTGIRITHQDFGGRAVVGNDSVGDGRNGIDCNGHGTHVAGTVGGTTWGVAKNVKLYAVRVLDCNGSGTNAGVIAGIDWVKANHVKPAVANMSLGGGASQALDDSLTAAINAGVTFVVAAGNDGANACNYSPARAPAAITVGATGTNDGRTSWSNYGTCVDIFAPGDNITSAWMSSDTSTNTISGTSMASPHTAGVAALYLQTNPTASPATVANALVGQASPGKVGSPGTGSPNLLLYMGFITGDPNADVTAPTTTITAPAGGSTVQGNVTLGADASDNVGVTKVDFLVDGAVVGSDTTAPYGAVWNSAAGANGAHSITSRAYDAAGNIGTSAAVSVTVNNPGFASYDPVLKAPKCGTAGARCDAGSLVNGRASLGPETNQPNTINGSCADGTSGTYHSDESIDGLRVISVDGTDFAAGKSVRIEATVWAYSGYTSDHLELYYAADASAPAWTLIGEWVPPGAGAQTMSATYTLPSGTLQAVRAVFRYNGTAGACVAGSYTDRDDLIFAVGGGGGGGDTTAPTASITAPAAGATVSGTVTVSASASDNVGVTKVDFYDGATLIGSDTTSPYGVSWNTAAVANGSHTLTAKASDAAGNVGTSAGVTVTVSNATACGTTEQLLANPGFELGAVSWVSTAGVISSGTSGSAPRTGTYKAWLNGYGSAHTDSAYQQITIPSTACTATLTFWVKITTAETTTTVQYDKLAVQVRNSAGTVLSTLATYSNLNKSTAYVQKTFNLIAYKGQTIRVHFNGTEDSSLQTSFFLDDTALTITR